MEQWIMDFLGPVAGVPMAIGALWAWWQRRALRKGHIVALVALAAVGLVGFVVTMLAAWGRRIPDLLLMPLLQITAWMTVFAAGAFTVAFWVLWFRRPEKTGDTRRSP